MHIQSTTTLTLTAVFGGILKIEIVDKAIDGTASFYDSTFKYCPGRFGAHRSEGD